MEEMWSSLRPAKPSYGDVFGGAPNYTAKSNDYSEIFGGFASSCSIPFLELPPPNESDDGGGLTDYSEIFGAYKAADFAVDYQELFSKKSVERVQIEAKYSQPVGASDISPEGASDLDYGACSEKNKFSSHSSHSDDGSKQLKMSYHGASHGCIEDVITGKTHTTQPYTEPGSTYPINSYAFLQNRRSNNSLDIQANDLIPSTSCNGQLNDAGQDKIASVPSSGDNIKSYGADLKSNENDINTNPDASEGGLVHKKHHSRSSSNYAASSGDIPYPDVTYVSISDINLRTKPSRMPPPSRAPPKLINKHDVIKVKMNSRGGQGESSLKPAWTQQVHYSIGSAKSHGLQGVVKDNSSGFLDVEVDAHSALAASAAAMKEAMEQAQAKLKNAKELMDRKRENLPGRKKMGNKESAKFDERKRVTAFEEEKMFGEVKANKPLQKEDKERKEHTSDDMQKTIKLGTAASYDDLQGNGFNSSQICNKSEEANGEWRTEKQFYELINNVKKFGNVKEAYKHDGFENKLNTTSKVGENVINYSGTAELDREFNGAVKVYKISEPVERDEINHNSKAYNGIHKEEIIKKADKIPETCMPKESKSEESHGCHYRNGDKKSQTAQEALFSAEEWKKSNGGKEATCVENEMSVESSNNYSKIGDVYHGNEENRNFSAVKATPEHDVKEKQSCEHYVTSMLYESEKKMEGIRGTGVQHENGNDINVAMEAHVIEAEEIALEEAYPCENSDYTWGNGKMDSHDEENECQLEDAAPINAHEEHMLNRAHGVCMTVENDFNNQGGKEAKENFQELKPAPDITELKESEEKINSANERCWSDYNSMERRDTHQEYQQNEKKQDVEQTTSVVKNTEEPGVFRDDRSWGKNGKFREGTAATMNMDIKFDATEAIFQRSENRDIEDVENGSKCENEDLGDSSQEVFQNPSSSHTVKETLGTADTENCNHDVRKRYKPECEKTIVGESDHEKEQARELEEEKAGEREREKERLVKCMESATREAQAIEEEKAREREKEKERIVKCMERATREAQSIEEEMVREREREKERLVEHMERATCEAQAIEEEKLREREREKEQLMKSMERATREAHERAARERAERIAVERATAEARQRALTEAREKVEKAAAEALEKSLAEKALKEAKLRAERAAVERATAEARERAVEKALAEKAAADARQRAERLNTISRDKVRKESEGGEYSAACDKDNQDVKLKAASSDVLNNQRFRSTGPSGSSQRYTDSSAHGEDESPLRCKARFERHQRTVERAAKALAEKNTRDILAQQEQAERNRLAESLDADVRRWSTGKEGNLRALLSTLQYILGPESGWQPIPLTDVITAVAVKKAYRKATLYVHPDKLQQRRASIQQKYICEKVFDLLKEAWNRFNSEER